MAKFSPSDKLFHILKESADWGSTLGVDTVGGLNEAIADGRIQDLILIQEAAMEQNIGEIAKRIASDPERKFVMIAGAFLPRGKPHFPIGLPSSSEPRD